MKALASDDFELRSIATLPLIQFAIKDAKVLAALQGCRPGQILVGPE